MVAAKNIFVVAGLWIDSHQVVNVLLTVDANLWLNNQKRKMLVTVSIIFINVLLYLQRASLVAQTVKNLPAVQETWV